ncbi:MAG: hypothetical protein HOM68_13055 [Gemmatimonadetes bacterium]|nr:hypothetical protein [Gemmatimonadota bacterium]
MEMKKIAAIITAYYPFSHADVIISKFLKGFPTDSQLEEPQVEIVSFYLDQIHPRDVGVELAKQCDIPIFESIAQALTLDGTELAVDGVLLIGEHGEYAWNEKGQHLYPRRYFFEQVCGVIAASGRSVPIFSNKHLAWNWDSAKWMYDRAKTLGVPFMAGSSLPVSYRNPGLEYELETAVTEAVSMAYGGLDSYGFHALETLQCMVERRSGGETGIKRVQCLEGTAVWEAGQAGRWSQDLFDAAAHHIENRESGDPRQLCEAPALYLMEYADGLQTATFILSDYIKGWGYAGRVEGQVQGTEFYLHGDPHPHFSYLCLNAQQMFLSGEATYPVERTLLITGALEALLDSRHRGHVAVDTPHLDVSYTSYKQPPPRAEGRRPTGAALVPFRPE